MRAAVVLLLAACSVPAKQPIAGDGGVDGLPDVPPDGTPDTQITSAPAEFSNQASARFEFISNDANATFQCSIDGDSPIPCHSPYSRTLNDGPHSFSVRAIGASGMSDDTPAEALWTIDTVAPETTITSAPPGADNSTMVRFEFISNELDVVFECSLDGAPFSACTSGSMFGPVGDGAHAFSVRARDRAGNADASPAVRAWTTDTSTPDTQITSGPSGRTSATSATFAFLSPDAGSGATFECALDGSGFGACASPKAYSSLGEGAHTFAVRVRDASGNVDPSPATRTWTVDLTAPETTITGGPSGTVAMASATFSFTSSEPGSTFQCLLDGGAFAACTSPDMLTGLAQGPHTFSVRAIDGAGHADATPATRSWTVDTAGPDVTFTAGPANGSTSGPRVTFGFAVTEGMPQCSLDTAAFAACTSPVAFNARAGAHQFRVRATDAAGNTTTELRAWTIACAAPDPAGAVGLLHLDDTGQTLANATGGPAATLGDDATVEAADPAPLAAGRFGGALSFTAAQADHASWPAAIAGPTELAIELWLRPDASAGSEDVLASGDGRVAIRIAGGRVSATLTEASGPARTATSAAVAAGAWHHVLASLREPTLHLWVDGDRTDAGNVTMGTPPALDAIRLGGSYDGDLDEVWISASAIVDDETALARYCPP